MDKNGKRDIVLNGRSKNNKEERERKIEKRKGRDVFKVKRIEMDKNEMRANTIRSRSKAVANERETHVKSPFVMRTQAAEKKKMDPTIKDTKKENEEERKRRGKKEEESEERRIKMLVFLV